MFMSISSGRDKSDSLSCWLYHASHIQRAEGGDPASGSLVRLETEPGDYVWVPPHVPHREENPSPDTEAVVVIARSTQEAIVVNVPGF
jgi:quercetin dioxygenase-like cupin family protein